MYTEKKGKKLKTKTKSYRLSELLETAADEFDVTYADSVLGCQSVMTTCARRCAALSKGEFASSLATQLARKNLGTFCLAHCVCLFPS